MLILGLLGMYFDAAVVFVTKSSLFSDWLWPYCDPYQNSGIFKFHILESISLFTRISGASVSKFRVFQVSQTRVHIFFQNFRGIRTGGWVQEIAIFALN